jgi:hypothetical protein
VVFGAESEYGKEMVPGISSHRNKRRIADLLLSVHRNFFFYIYISTIKGIYIFSRDDNKTYNENLNNLKSVKK